MRDYDPVTGRYYQADPLGLIDGASIYGYALQNPGKYTDPRGEAVCGGLCVGGFVLGVGARAWVKKKLQQWAAAKAANSIANADSEARKHAQYRRYKRVCGQPNPPPSGDLCKDAKERRNRAQQCYDLRKNWSDKWDKPGSSSWVKHQRALKNVKEQLRNANNDIHTHCNQTCLVQ